MARALFVVALLVAQVFADCYLQYPPGSNDRLNEQNADRNNANRLFRSENNARGGYCWDSTDAQLQFYVGSVLPVQWTAQHGCNSDNVECNFVIQYMCTDNSGVAQTQLRDGTTTNTINANNVAQKTGADFTFGMHEPLAYSEACNDRERNKGLFTADQNLNGDTAQFTRQNPGGTQYGFECNEEENYYPYWHPTPWRDVAVLSATEDRCAYYQAESQNVVGKNYCQITTKNNQNIPNNEQACQSAGGKWTLEPAFGIAAPDCQVANYSRDNHLGNGADGETASYSWTIPEDPCVASASGCACALRVRYNISTANTDNWGFIDSRFNGDNSPVQENPTVGIEDGELTLALNTNQYGRTFQDRSHSFKIAARPADVPADQKIYNLGVRGKRGNIVQTFPATEYDYVPTNLAVTTDDLVHFQWTGCDNNPQGNAGEGTDQTDRSNIVQVDTRRGNIPLTNGTQMADQGVVPMFDSDELRHHMAFIGQTNCKTQAQLLRENGNNQNNVNVDPENCAKLNKASPYFNAGLVQMNNTGTFQYMSTRNNNFSNRSQKGTIVVNPGAPKADDSTIAGKLTPAGSAGVAVGVIAAVGLTAGAVAFFVYGKKNPHSFAGQTLSNLGNIGGGSNHGYSASAPRKEPLLG